MMKTTGFRILITVFSLVTLLCMYAHAAPAEDITQEIILQCSGVSEKSITDGNLSTHSAGTNIIISGNASIPLEGIYIKYNNFAPEDGGILDGETRIALNGFVHEYIPLNGSTSFTLSYSSADICDIQVFSQGTLPGYVQQWEKGEGGTDILLCATHSDDDQLFFAGLLPYYAGYKRASVRVAYFINHYNTYNRTHELLDGLWECGVKLYPDISPFPDYYSESSAQAEKTLSAYGFDRKALVDFQRSLIEKYRPLVVVLHDFDGEYGHGAHILNTETFIEACETTEENEYIPEKIYVHLYGENTITLDVIDVPLDAFDGRSAFNVSQDAFRHHKSQHWTWFYKWIYGKNTPITKASEISTYNPAKYGLYFSRVGDDTEKNDLLENVKTYAVREAETKEVQKLILRRKRVIENWRNGKDAFSENICNSSSSITSNTSAVMCIIAVAAFVFIAVLLLLRLTKRK